MAISEFIFLSNMATLVHFFHKNPLCMSELHWIGVMDLIYPFTHLDLGFVQ
jgi:hypothetical protein